MKLNTFFQVAATTAILTVSSYASNTWMTDFVAAKKKAAAENKSLLVNFTGSDWCHGCIKLEDEVFSKPEFKGSDKFVLVKIDFPMKLEETQSKALQKQNQMLKDKYGVPGFPVVLLLDDEGRPFANTGYRGVGPSEYNEHLDELLVVRKTRDKAFADAMKLKNKAERSKVYSEALKAMDDVDPAQYPKILNKILEGDPSNKEANIILLYASLDGVETEKQIKKAFGEIDRVTEKINLEGEEKQQLQAIKLEMLFQTGNIEQMAPVMDSIIAIAPDSKTSKKMTYFKNNRYPAILKKAQELRK